MDNIKKLQAEFSEASQFYQKLKTETEQEVVNWFWATDNVFDLEPFYFETYHFPKGRKLKDEPLDKDNKYHYGVNSENQIILERQYTGLTGLFYETFYVWEEDVVKSFRYDYSNDDKDILNIQLFIYEGSQIKFSYTVVEDGWIKNSYTYENSKLISRLMQRIYMDDEVADRIFKYTYNEIGLLDTIKEKDHIWYKKPDKQLTYKKLSELVSTKLFELLKQNILEYNIKEKLYCIYVFYYHEDLLPPTIGFGTESDREEWIKEEGRRAKWIIWNPIDYSHSCELELDEETQNIFHLFNQETSLNNKENNAIKIIVNCCMKLKENISEFNLDTTDDFAIVAADYEQGDLKKNFKRINPEMYDDYKNKLV